jgi:cyanophycinase
MMPKIIQAALILSWVSCAQLPGPIVLAGGGSFDDAFFRRTLQLCETEYPAVIIFSQASQLEETSSESSQVWTHAGAASTFVADFRSTQGWNATLEHLSQADVIWFTGGSQLRLTAAIESAEFLPHIKARWREGAVIGGTSAGSAVMGEIMPSGKNLYPGFGICRNTIVDQHFTERNRQSRLRHAVRVNHGYRGIGISESTAVFLHGRHAHTYGSGMVHVYKSAEALRVFPPNSIVSVD